MATTKTKPMPVFWPDKARAELGDARYEAALRDPLSVDLLNWNIFQSLETHQDQDWLAYRLQMFGGTDLAPPVRMQLWTGRATDPRMEPSRGYLQAADARAREAGATDEDIARMREPIEVPVRIESPDVLCLVHTVLDRTDRGTAGRDRLLELIDGGIEHARRLGKQLAVAVVYRAGSQAATELSGRLNELRGSLAEELPHQPKAKDVQLRDMSWQQLVRVWESEMSYLDLPGSPKAFLSHLKANDLY